jgi:hypothetical protein
MFGGLCLVVAARPKGETPESTYLDLPAGRSGRVDWALHGEDSYSGYSFTDGATSLRLVCLAKDPPADRWRSIAETFEFLPQGE